MTVKVFDEDWWMYLEHIARSRKVRNMRVRVPEGKSTPIQELVGVAAEAAFGFWLGCSEDEVEEHMNILEPTKGWQWEYDNMRIRVTGTETPGHLVQRTNLCTADIYVLAKVEPKEQRVTFIGWTDITTLMNAEIREKVWPTQVIESYWLPATSLRSMERLKGAIRV